MQKTGHVIVNEEVLLVFLRKSSACRALRIRKRGERGDYLNDAEMFLRENPSAVEMLKNGEVIKL